MRDQGYIPTLTFCKTYWSPPDPGTVACDVFGGMFTMEPFVTGIRRPVVIVPNLLAGPHLAHVLHLPTDD